MAEWYDTLKSEVAEGMKAAIEEIPPEFTDIVFINEGTPWIHARRDNETIDLRFEVPEDLHLGREVQLAVFQDRKRRDALKIGYQLTNEKRLLEGVKQETYDSVIDYFRR